MTFLKRPLWKRWVTFWSPSWQFSAKNPFFPQNSKKTLSSTPLPGLKNVTKLNIFPGKFPSRRSLSGQTKTQFWQSVFKVQKTSAKCLEKVLKKLIQPKKDRLRWQISPDLCEPVLTILLKLFNNSTIFFTNFYEDKPLHFRKSYPTAYNFPGKKNIHEKINLYR